MLTQCSSLDLNQCQNSDWFSLGLQDGNNGAHASRINDYAEDCAEFGIRVNHSDWREGYLKGLQNYCQPENGYRVGLAGEGYAGVCSSNAFVEQYNAATANTSSINAPMRSATACVRSTMRSAIWIRSWCP